MGLFNDVVEIFLFNMCNFIFQICMLRFHFIQVDLKGINQLSIKKRYVIYV
jgi:hypothetical protein